jgi:hypothetical protein
MARDPRRIGIGAAALSGVYVVALFIPDAALATVLGVLGAIGAVMLAVFVPLRPWREAPDRRRVAAAAMSAEAIAVAVVATIIRLVV